MFISTTLFFSTHCFAHRTPALVFRSSLLHATQRIQLVTWDYRGLFDSTKGTESLNTPYLSMRDNANDALVLMDKLGWISCDSFIGYSTGVQVGLELAAMRPERVGSLILLNGTHGQLLHSMLQVRRSWGHETVGVRRAAKTVHA